jgi:glycerol kinase
MLETSGADIAALRVDGGAAADDFLMQLQADLLGIPVYRSRFHETTALGAAALAGLAVGFWSRSDLDTITGTEDVFQPELEASERDALYSDWRRAVERALDWVR